MNYIRHLSAFFFRHTKLDPRLNANHISLYMALFQYWNINRFQNPFTISRIEVMAISGIGSKNTYHKCLKELHQFGYIYYRASLSKFQKSSVHIVKLDTLNSGAELQQLHLFDPKNEPLIVSKAVQVNPSPGIKTDAVPVSNFTAVSPKIGTVPVPYLGLLIKHKHINSKQEREANTLTQIIFSKNQLVQKCINAFGVVPLPVHRSPVKPATASPSLSGEGSNLPAAQASVRSRPTLPQVLSFFILQQYPPEEAHKFFNHYQSNGWLVAGKTPMQDWPASAHKWILNAQNFIKNHQNKNATRQQTNDFDSGPGKDYAQPL